MADPTPELPTLDSVLGQLKGRRNFLLGSIAIVLLVVIAGRFVRQQFEDHRYSPWRGLLLSTNNPPWRASKDDAATIAEKVQGTKAESIAAYFKALRTFQDGDHVTAYRELEGLKQKDPGAYVWTAKFPSVSLFQVEPLAAGERTMRQIAIYAKWSEQYPAPSVNPTPPPGNVVALVTESGTIALGLYVDKAPKSCAAFAKMAEQLKEQFIARALQNKWIELGQDAQGTAVVLKETEGEFPPYEINDLSHFKGSVAFNQRPFGTAPFKGDLKIWLDTEFEQDGSSTVFAQVLNEEGLKILEQASAGERSTERPGVLLSPLKITDVHLQMQDMTPQPPK